MWSMGGTPATTQAVNWSGCIPVRLTLAPTSVSSPTIPRPIHVLVPRLTFLHVGLQSAVQRLHPFAPLSPFLTGRAMLQISEPDPPREGDSDDGDDDKPKAIADKKDQVDLHHKEASQATNDANTSSTFVYPVCWFEDEDTKMAVRWHLFAGVLFDVKSERSLPWKLILHFTNYPESQNFASGTSRADQRAGVLQACAEASHDCRFQQLEICDACHKRISRLALGSCMRCGYQIFALPTRRSGICRGGRR